MTSADSLQAIRTELEEGIRLRKCQQCGCMDSALKNIAAALSTTGTEGAFALAEFVSDSLEKMQSIQYACLGCEHCYPAEAQSAFDLAFPALKSMAADLSCDFRVREESWPPVAGEYFILDRTASVAVSTLASVQLVEEIAHSKPSGLAIVGKTETENIGIDKIVKNIIASPAIRYLIVAGADSKGHFAGQTLMTLAANGVDENGRVIGSTGKRPVLRNVSSPEIEAFRQQVQVMDMLGCENPDEICAQIEELARQAEPLCGSNAGKGNTPISISTPPRIRAKQPDEVVKLDKAGYFVIIPLADRGVLHIEHYAYDNALMHIIEGEDARSIYSTIIQNNWVTELSHAAYLGKELEKAELSLQHGFKYVQDGT